MHWHYDTTDCAAAALMQSQNLSRTSTDWAHDNFTQCRFVLTAIICWPAGEPSYLVSCSVRTRRCLLVMCQHSRAHRYMCLASTHFSGGEVNSCGTLPVQFSALDHNALSVVRKEGVIWLMRSSWHNLRHHPAIFNCAATSQIVLRRAVMYCCCKDEANNCFGTPARVNASTSMAVPF